MKISENRFFKPTVIHLTPSPYNPYGTANSARAYSDNREITDSIVARSKNGSYDEVSTDSETNNWSPLSFMQWFSRENKDSKLPGTDNMEVMKYDDDENDDKSYSEKNDPANNPGGNKPERGSVKARN